MEINPKNDFLYSLDGYTTTAFKKGVVVSIPDNHGKILEKAGYLTTSVEVKPENKIVEDTRTLLDIEGIKPAFIPKLKDIGVETVADLQTKSIDELKSIDGISEKMARVIIENLNK